MQTIDKKLTAKEKLWIKEYFKAEGNAAAATREAYGGTPGACRVKGHKKLNKFRHIINEIVEREFDKMQYREISGIDFYLGNLERNLEGTMEFEEFMKGGKVTSRLLM
jgi:hypothetical protein